MLYLLAITKQYKKKINLPNAILITQNGLNLIIFSNTSRLIKKEANDCLEFGLKVMERS